MSDKNFDKEYGLDPRQRANLRPNSTNSPQGIDWDILMNAGLEGKNSEGSTIWGQAESQRKDLKANKEAIAKNKIQKESYTPNRYNMILELDLPSGPFAYMVGDHPEEPKNFEIQLSSPETDACRPDGTPCSEEEKFGLNDLLPEDLKYTEKAIEAEAELYRKEKRNDFLEEEAERRHNAKYDPNYYL